MQVVYGRRAWQENAFHRRRRIPMELAAPGYHKLDWRTANQGDLLSRSIVVNFMPIPESERKAEKEMNPLFDAALPRILGALFGAVALAIKNGNPLPRKPRMADFTQWAYNGLGEMGDSFLQAYRENIAYVQEIALEASPLAQELMKMELPFEGSYQQLLDELTDPMASHDPVWLPKSGKALANELRALAQNLASQGIQVQEAGHKHHGNMVKIERREDGEH